MLRKQGRFVEFSVFGGATTVTATSSLHSVYLDREGAQRS